MADMPEPMPQIEQLSGRMYGAAFDLSKAAMNVAASNIAMKSRIAELEAENARLSAMSATPRTPIFTCHKEDCAIKDCSIPLVGEEAIASCAPQLMSKQQAADVMFEIIGKIWRHSAGIENKGLRDKIIAFCNEAHVAAGFGKPAADGKKVTP